jgi:hypothetical protein
MKTLLASTAAAALVTGVMLIPSGQGDSTTDAAMPSNTYRLVANGDEGACAVSRGAPVSQGLSLLSVAPSCRRLLPGIEQAKFWREGDDGTVAFSANGLDPIVTFSVADGDGYESYAPATPLLALAAAGGPDD